MLKALGELDRARELQEQVLEVQARTQPDDHPSLQTARANLTIWRSAYDSGEPFCESNRIAAFRMMELSSGEICPR